MLFLLQQLWWSWFLAGALAGTSGWILHRILSAPRLRELERERDRLRSEFAGLASGERPSGLRKVTDDRELAFLRTRESIAGAKVAELDRALAEVREQRDAHAGRAAELERALDRMSADANSAKQRAGALEADLAGARAEPRADEMNALRWRLRYFEARTRYLEGAGRSTTNADAAALEILQRERDAARVEVEELRGRQGQSQGQSEAQRQESDALKWRARFLESRVRSLEGRESPAPDAETELRRTSRMRYLEGRINHLEGRAAAAATEADENRRLTWRASYLDERVRHLEEVLARTEPAAPAPSRQEESPMTSEGAEIRPAAAAAPREGAPDDLMVIGGMDAKTESSLHALGIFHIDQIAQWSHANVSWLDQYLRLRGRISREQWVEQAKALSQGAQAGRKLYFEAEMA